MASDRRNVPYILLEFKCCWTCYDLCQYNKSLSLSFSLLFLLHSAGTCLHTLYHSIDTITDPFFFSSSSSHHYLQVNTTVQWLMVKSILLDLFQSRLLFVCVNIFIESMLNRTQFNTNEYDRHTMHICHLAWGGVARTFYDFVKIAFFPASTVYNGHCPCAFAGAV